MIKALMFITGGVFVGLLAAPSWGVARAQGPLASWEHTCIGSSTVSNRIDSALAQLKTETSRLGQQGWEMVSVATPPDRVLMCFKRQGGAK